MLNRFMRVTFATGSLTAFSSILCLIRRYPDGAETTEAVLLPPFSDSVSLPSLSSSSFSESWADLPSSKLGNVKAVCPISSSHSSQ